MSIDRAIFEEAASAIANAESIVLACHVGPDGDALGSMLGIATAATDAGKKVFASFGSPHIVPAGFDFLPVDLLQPPDAIPETPELMVVLDCGSADRLAELGSNATAAGTLIVIDHHVTNEGFGDIAVVDHTAAATGELVYELLGVIGWEVTKEVAQCLLTALVTDTGRFQYSNTTPTTMRIAAELIARGGEPAVIGRHIYEEAPFGYLKAAGVAMDRAALDVERSVVSTVITSADLDENGIDWGDTDNLIDLLRLAVEADTAVLVKGHEDGRVKVSLRSRGATDVGGLAAAMGGGGHRLAAGFTTEGDAAAILASVIEVVEEYR